jgi:hypothetical protein
MPPKPKPLVPPVEEGYIDLELCYIYERNFMGTYIWDEVEAVYFFP